MKHFFSKTQNLSGNSLADLSGRPPLNESEVTLKDRFWKGELCQQFVAVTLTI